MKTHSSPAYAPLKVVTLLAVLVDDDGQLLTKYCTLVLIACNLFGTLQYILPLAALRRLRCDIRNDGCLPGRRRCGAAGNRRCNAAPARV